MWFDISELLKDGSDVQWVTERRAGERIKFTVNSDFELLDLVVE